MSAVDVHHAEERLQTILKAVVVSAKTQDPASRPGGEDLAQAFASAGALDPPYDPEALCLLMEHSNSLRQNVDAYATNIDGFGHRQRTPAAPVGRQTLALEILHDDEGSSAIERPHVHHAGNVLPPKSDREPSFSE